jgi:hypothetical protein
VLNDAEGSAVKQDAADFGGELRAAGELSNSGEPPRIIVSTAFASYG